MRSDIHLLCVIPFAFSLLNLREKILIGSVTAVVHDPGIINGLNSFNNNEQIQGRRDRIE